MLNDQTPSDLVKTHSSAIPFSSEEIPNAQTLQNSGGVVCFQFRHLAMQPHLVHGVFARLGGFSAPPYSSLNTSFSTGDDPGHVQKNLSLILQCMGGKQLLFLDQVHGREILVLSKKDSSGLPIGTRADAVITDRKNLAVMIKQADCQAVLLYDPAMGVIAAAHCGWRGNVLNLLGSVVDRMNSEFGCSRSRLLAAIGPSLGPCCAEFRSYREIFPEDFRTFMVRENYFDLWQISRAQLLESGLDERKIHIAGVCTACRTDLFYSYRREKTTGRFATAAMLV